MPQQQTVVSPAQPSRCILRLPEVERRTGYKRAHIYNLMRENKFPQNTKIGARAVGWDSLEIDHWVNAQLDNHR